MKIKFNSDEVLPLNKTIEIRSMAIVARANFYENSKNYLGTFSYYCTWGRLNNGGGGELHKIKRSRDKTEIGKELLW